MISRLAVVWSLLLLLACCVSSGTAAAEPLHIGFLAGSGGLGDESFNDAAYAGIGRAAEETKSSIVVRQWEESLSMNNLLQELLAAGCQIIVLNGDQFAPLIDEFAPRHPNVYFIANDFAATPADNVRSIVYSQHEGAFLAGVLAGSFSKSGYVSFLGAIDIPVVRAFEIAYVQGVKHVSPTTRVRVDYISTFPDYSGFNAPGEAREVARVLYDSGVEVIFAVAGASGNGVIQAARETGKYVIGVDSDQDHMAKGLVLTSVMKRMDIAVYQEIIAASQGRHQLGLVHYGLESNGVSLSAMRFSKEIIGPEILELLENTRKAIIAREIAVTDFLTAQGNHHR